MKPLPTLPCLGRVLLVGAAALCGFSIPVSAAPIFSASTFSTADTDVLNIGTTAFAFDYTDFYANALTTTTVNGVTFGGSLTQGAVSLSDTAFSGGGVNGVIAVPATMSPAYQSVLQDLVYVQGAVSFTLNGLTAGHTYDLQLFSGSTGPQGTQTLNDGSSVGYLDYNKGPSSNSFVVDQFVASAGGTETISYSAGTYDIINAVNVRDLGAVSAPEPSTYALMLGGLAFLGLCFRRKNGLVK